MAERVKTRREKWLQEISQNVDFVKGKHNLKLTVTDSARRVPREREDEHRLCFPTELGHQSAGLR